EKGPPTIKIASPQAGAKLPDMTAVSVSGTVSDPDGVSTVNVTVNDVAATIQPAPVGATSSTFTATVNMTHRVPATLVARATDTAQQTSTDTVVICGAPPVELVTPAPGTTVATRTVSLTGSTGGATTVTVNGTNAAINTAAGTFSVTNFDLGAT